MSIKLYSEDELDRNKPIHQSLIYFTNLSVAWYYTGYWDFTEHCNESNNNFTFIFYVIVSYFYCLFKMTSTILYHSSYHFQSKYRWWMYFCPTFSLILLTSLTCVCQRVCGGQVWSMVPSRLCPPPTFSSLYMNTTHHAAPWPILPSNNYTRAS